ncbi:hypothetical protein ABC733_28380 [Mangrovibacter sp. SLW1]
MSTGIELMQHALGINERNREPYRNYFLAGDGHADNSQWQGLVTEGLATSRPSPDFCGGGVLYHVTDKGKALAISALPEPKKKTRYEEYLDADSCLSFSEWLLGYRLPEVEYNRQGNAGCIAAHTMLLMDTRAVTLKVSGAKPKKRPKPATKQHYVRR